MTNKMVLDTKDLVVIRKNNCRNDDSYNNLMLTNKKIATLITLQNVKEVSNLKELSEIKNEKIRAINNLRKGNKSELI